MLMVAKPRGRRIMLYSHDTFGLGHLRRTHAIAAALTADDPFASALILTSSPVAGRFSFPERVDHVRLPGVTKLSDGSYVSEALGLDIQEIKALRSSLILSAVVAFDPDLLIVDKEPNGVRGELLPALERLFEQGRCRVVLGLRDVLDDRDAPAAEWRRKGCVQSIERFYHEIWVYGTPTFHDPTEGPPLSPEVRNRMHWTGHLRRHALEERSDTEDQYILATAGGGDSADFIDLVLSAYEMEPDLGPRAVLVYGLFLAGDMHAEFDRRVANLDGRVTATVFEAQIEQIYKGARGVVCMGVTTPSARFCPSTSPR